MKLTETWNALDSTGACRVMNMPQPIVVANHLCASIVTESASSIPARMPRSRSDAISAPPQAASTWYQIPEVRAISAQAARGSIMPALDVPAVAAIMTGTRPCARSASNASLKALGSMRPHPSVATIRTAARPMPAWCAILSQARWLSLET